MIKGTNTYSTLRQTFVTVRGDKYNFRYENCFLHIHVFISECLLDLVYYTSHFKLSLRALSVSISCLMVSQ